MTIKEKLIIMKEIDKVNKERVKVFLEQLKMEREEAEKKGK